MLRELKVVEQRYQAVLRVLDGIPVTEVAEWFGVARQTVHRWVARYRDSGIGGLADRSHAPKSHPGRISAEVEAVICDLRSSHRRWGPRRLVFELARRGHGDISRSTVYRVLVRHQLLEPVPRCRRRDQYRRACDERPHRPAAGRTGPGARAAGRLPGQDAAVPAGCPRPGSPGCGWCPPGGAAAAAPASGDVIEVERTVNASGDVSLGSHIVRAGLPLAGQRVTLQLDGPVARILSGGILARTIACPVPRDARTRLRGARAGTAQPPRLPEPVVVTRRVSVRGAIMIGGQRIQVGLAHARKTAEVAVEAGTYQITVEPGITITAPRTASSDIRRHKASNYSPDAPPGVT